MDETPRLDVSAASMADAETWLRLQGRGDPESRADEIEAFRAAPAEVTRNRFVVRHGGRPIACFRLQELGGVVELKELAIPRAQRTPFGASVLRAALELARERGTLVTAAYPEAYSPIFLQAGFEQHTRRQMRVALPGLEIPGVALRPGVRLRHPRDEDEAAVGALAFRNYAGTVDGDWVSASLAQAAAIMRAIFGEEYAAFQRDCSFLAETAEAGLAGSILLGDFHDSPPGSLLWILDISVAPEWRGRGLGRALMASALRAAQAEGFGEAGLTVTEGNDRALALYESLGFRAAGSLLYEAVHRLGRAGGRSTRRHGG